MENIKILTIENLKRSDLTFDESIILIPQPKLLEQDPNKSCLIINSDCVINCYNLDNSLTLLEDINDFLSEISSCKIRIGDEFQNISLEDMEEVSIPLESFYDDENLDVYNLHVFENRIIIHGRTEKGIFYGVQTIIQLIKNCYIHFHDNGKLWSLDSNSVLIPVVKVKDSSDLKIRGVAQDISRGQIFTVENVKRYIKIISHYKMNFYCVYIEDVFSHPKYPEIGRGRGALSVEEIREIDEYAKDRYIEFIPIFECLGHVDNILSHEEYDELGEFPGAQCFNVVNDDVFQFLDDYISRLSAAFSTNWFHIGCDESFDFGKYRSAEYFKRVGKSQAYVEFYEKIYKIALKHGNEHVIMYHDIVVNDDEILEKLNKDIILMFWDYNPREKYPKVEKLLNAGFEVIVSPSMLNWQRNFPDNINSTKNVYNLVKTAYENREKGCLGVINSTWGDFRYYSLRENEIYGAIYCASVSWNFTDFNYQNFNKDFGHLFYGIKKELLDQFDKLYSLISSSALHYYNYDILLPPFFYTYLFKHPFPSENYKPSCKNIDKLGDLGNECLQLHANLLPHITFEKHNYEYIEFGAELAKYLLEKLKISEEITIKLKKSSETNNLGEIISRIEYIRDKFKYLKNKYEKLWLRAAKRPCLDVILNLFDFIINCYDKKIEELNQGIRFKDPYIPSEWIWVKEKECPKKPRYFRKIFKLKQPVKKAIIQVIACNHAKVYVNSEYIGNVYSRFSLSILPIINRVKIFDITNLIHEGENIIAIEAYNYEGFKGAINLYGQILHDNGEIVEIKTDISWNCYKNGLLENDDWKDVKYNDSEWKPVKSYGRPPNLNGDIFKPDLLGGEKSLTQDYFGMQSFFYNAMTIFFSYFLGKYYKILQKLLKLLSNLIIKRTIKKIKPYD